MKRFDVTFWKALGGSSVLYLAAALSFVFLSSAVFSVINGETCTYSFCKMLIYGSECKGSCCLYSCMHWRD